jgi:hypothetical protein
MRGMFLRSAADLELDISKSALSKRGWILQERFLSTRILHFTAGMIYLETARGIKSEDGETPMDLARMTVMAADLLTLDQFLHQKPVTLQNFSTCLPQSFRTMHENSESSSNRLSPWEWFPLLEMYSTCSLTKEQDKLTAISGIAQICRQTTASPYLAGIWADRLAIGLMWMSVGAPLSMPSLTRASSWSWAAYDGPTQFPLAGDSVPYDTNCYLVTNANLVVSWCNGPWDLTVQADVLDLSADLQCGDLLISLYRETLHPQRLGSATYDALWKFDYDPPIRLFDIFTVHRFLWNKDLRFISDNSWIVFDCENSFQKQDDCKLPLSCISMATFTARDDNRVRVPLRMVIFVVPAERQNTCKRIGAGVIRKTFMQNLTVLREHGPGMWKGWSPPNTGEKPAFIRREITLV